MIPTCLRDGDLAVRTAVAGTVLIAAFAFWLSFTALSDLARRSGVEARQAWAWPLIVDGLIVVATVAAVALDRRAAAWYPWLLLMAGTVVSVTANALHATVAADPDVPGLLAACVAAVPPLVLLASTHLTVVLVRSRRTVRGLITEGAEGVEVAAGAETESVSGVGRRRGFAERLREEGWSNKAIARRLGVAPSTVGRWFTKAETAKAHRGYETPREMTT
ncbi:DUF2637 domain-containing protein [Sinomonas sp. G460-2]|uniref:DUF2637 domain-containing protein n=1 Tax=Sinomonas sp. G460-2 TaxID=3393464 RepID=UPI0039F110F7